MSLATIAKLKDLHLQPGLTIHADVSVEKFVQMLKYHKITHASYIVIEGEQPVGVIRSHDMFRILGTYYGVALNYKKRVRDVMSQEILIVDWATPVDEVSRRAMTRSYQYIYDDIVVTKNQKFVGVTPVYELLNYMTDWKVREAIQRNPLSGLPGNERIQEVIDEWQGRKQPFSVVYSDIDHFKSYNDIYGFKPGDDMIKWTSQILQSPNISSLFVGHIGGDDFVACVDIELAEFYCQSVINQFEQEKFQFYSQQDIERGYLISLDRNHRSCQFPLASISMAIIDIPCEEWVDLTTLSEIAANIKKKAKQLPGSIYCREKLV